MKVKVKKLHKDAVIPTYAKLGDAGLDLTAISKEYEKRSTGDEIITYGTGLAFEIPEGYVGLLFSRSSVSKTSLIQTNCVGVIDSGYRGEVKIKFRIDANVRPTQTSTYSEGDRVCQLLIVPYPVIELEETEQLTNTERGEGGFGSTNN